MVAALYSCFERKTKNIGSVENRISLVLLPLTHDAWWGQGEGTLQPGVCTRI